MQQQPFDATRIQPHMPVVASNGDQVGLVDHVDASNTIKLTRDKEGQHHWIPMSWVTGIDSQIHVDRPGKQAMQQWSTTDPNMNLR